MKMVGAQYLGNNRCAFCVWAPEKLRMHLHLVSPVDRSILMQQDEDGYFSCVVEGVPPGSHYFFTPDGKKDFPDPASCYQPQGVHGPSEVVDHRAFRWADHHWRGLPFRDLILYEIHVGTFTPEGTFEAIIPRLDHMAALGVNAIELMPISQFPGNRNWGYDGVYPYSVQHSYGGPQGLKTLVDACHQKGIAVFLDVVYNHLGPEGNYFAQFAPYFTKKYCTPWGEALNFDGEWCDGVREYFSNNALYWFEQYHIDGLRIDAIHMVFDAGAVNFWEFTNNKVRQLQQRLGRSLYMVAESDLNSPRVTKDPAHGGFGFTAQWLDDFHHALYVLLDKDGRDRYIDFGQIEQLAKAYTDGFVHSGEYVKFRKRKHGLSSAGVPGDQFIAFNLNHDQVGNRVHGERLCVLVNEQRLKIAAAALMLSPYIPMLFMGEEYADESPFFYFVSHSDPALVQAVRKGRKEEFKNFKGDGVFPDPQDEKTFSDSILQWDKRYTGKHAMILEWHKRLIHLRKTHPALKSFDKSDTRAHIIGPLAFMLHRQAQAGKHHLICFFNLNEQMLTHTLGISLAHEWKKVISSKDEKWLSKTELPEVFPDRLMAGQTLKLPALSVGVFEAVHASEDQVVISATSNEMIAVN